MVKSHSLIAYSPRIVWNKKSPDLTNWNYGNVKEILCIGFMSSHISTISY